MKATKKQITEVTRIANEKGLNVAETIARMERMSKGIFEVIGVDGFFEAMAEVDVKEETKKAGYFNLDNCFIERETEKAFLVSLKQDLRNKQFWVAKSLIVDGYFPTWVAQK